MPPDATGDYQKYWHCIVVVCMAGYRHFKLSVEETMPRNCQNIEIINDLFEYNWAILKQSKFQHPNFSEPEAPIS